jgi:hypothetical protein
MPKKNKTSKSKGRHAPSKPPKTKVAQSNSLDKEDLDRQNCIEVMPEQVIAHLQPQFPNAKIEFGRFQGYGKYYYDDFTVNMNGKSQYFEIDWELLRKHPIPTDIPQRTSDQVVAILHKVFPDSTIQFRHFSGPFDERYFNECSVLINEEVQLFDIDWTKNIISSIEMYEAYDFEKNEYIEKEW